MIWSLRKFLKLELVPITLTDWHMTPKVIYMDAAQVAISKATVHAGIYQMEFGACFGGFLPVLVPKGLDFFFGLTEILTFGPPFRCHHFVNDGIRIKFFEVLMAPCCYRSIRRVAVYIIDVRPFFKTDL